MAAEILIVEDEPSIAQTLVYALTREGYATHHASILAAAWQHFQQATPALIILDVGLPDGSGLDFCKRVRAESDVPILFLSARSEEIDRVLGLELGGDDYVSKPFSPREVVARVKALLKRRVEAVRQDHTPTGGSDKRLLSGLEIDSARAQVRWRGTPLNLTRYEYLLLSFLAQQPQRVYTRAQILDAVWSTNSGSMERTVDTHVKSIRAKLRAVDAGCDLLQTHRGLGYSL